MNYKDLTFITGNFNKVEELNRNLGVTLTHQKLDLVEIQSLDIKEVVTHKAYEAFKIINKPVLVEDTSLVFHALGRLPGTYIKWFQEELDFDGLCKLLDQYEDKSVTAISCFGLYDGEEMYTFIGESRGRVPLKPRKIGGFGWDCIFVPEGSEKAWSEVSKEEKDSVSHRGRAVERLKVFLDI